MMIHEITPEAGRYRDRKRVGRGPGSGLGKTAGRGHKGAGSRAGHAVKRGFEGGQMPLFRRVPKRGFSNAAFKKVYAVVNLKAIDARFADGAQVTPQAMADAGLIPSAAAAVKILGTGATTKKLTVQAAAFSKSALEKIAQAGGTATVA
jgi:large subunit ribosomal protein L15